MAGILKSAKLLVCTYSNFKKKTDIKKQVVDIKFRKL